MSEKNPWKQCSSRTVYENQWIRVREDAVIRPDGKDGIYGVVETRIATGVVALTREDEVYLVGQYRYPTGNYSWEIPEGGTENGEGPLSCVQRELQEEAGLIAREWVQLGGEIHLSNCISSERAYVYFACDLCEVPSNPDGTEILKVKKVPLQKCVDMVYHGEITDAMSIIGILRAEAYLKHSRSIGKPMSGKGEGDVR